MEELHPKIRARLFSLQVLQTERDELFEKYSEERRQLEEKYEKLYAPLYNSRKEIVTGEKEYSDCDEDLKKEIEALPKDDASPSGVPDFWLVAMKNIEDLAEEISERDEACLSALVDVQTGKLEGEDEDGDEMVGFYLRFYFKENAFFTNQTIEKRYHMEDDSEDAVLNYIVCDDIDWKPGKNLTVKVLRKKPKPGAKNQKPITKTEPCESFFTFFYPPEVPDEDEQENMTEEEVEDLQEQMENDYAIGSLIATALVPNAVDHFLGLHLEDDEDEDEEEGEEDAEYGESIDGDSDDEEDDDDRRRRRRRRRKRGEDQRIGPESEGGVQATVNYLPLFFCNNKNTTTSQRSSTKYQTTRNFLSANFCANPQSSEHHHLR